MTHYAARVTVDDFRDAVPSHLAKRFRAEGWWGDQTLAQVIAGHAAARPDAPAFHADHGTTTWSQYDALSTELAAVLVAAGLPEGARVAVWLPDGATVHVTFVAAEKAGLTVVGIGARAGDRELAYLLAKTSATTLITMATHRGRDMATHFETLRVEVPTLAHHIIVPVLDGEPAGRSYVVDGQVVDPAGLPPAPLSRAMGPDDLFMLNSTSGTTGMPKCVMHNQNRWFYFHQKAAENGHLTSSDVFLSGVPAPFGFGLWTAHFTPAILGAPTVLRERFDADEALELIESYRATVVTCVSTQFIMMLNSPDAERRDLSSLRAMFTGGEAVPPTRARRFEEVTGASVLQFFGSNETGLLTGTTLSDSFEQRITTAGRVVPEMNVRLFDGDADVTASGAGQPAGHGPALCLGYLDDDTANAELYTEDGWMLMGDIVTIDDGGYLAVTGRTSDFIIRGGKNISAARVEEEVATHPAVVLAAAVAVPDEVFGERVCVYVELNPGRQLDLPSLQDHLLRRGASKSDFPEYLIVLDSLPRASGGKVAKGQLKSRSAKDLLDQRRSAQMSTRES
ncbi:MAG TPA: class I adenylate-forming enzyme family protein [Asanoa sp.]|nr:class I adenylate-forming enzyme family protein [Asanoa sp.]